jgi:hypothetical protein
MAYERGLDYSSPTPALANTCDLGHLSGKRQGSTLSSMDISSRKDISRRSRAHCSGICWYGQLVRSLGPCAYSSSRDQKRNPH